MSQFRFPPLFVLLVPLLLFSMAFIACGDDDDGGGSSGFATGTDEEYLSTVCGAFSDFSDGLFAAIISAGEDASEDDIAEALGEPFSEFVEALENARVPDDVKAYHGQVVSAFSEARDAIEDGDASIFEEESSFDEIPDPPAEIQERLNTAAADIDECAESNPFEA